MKAVGDNLLLNSVSKKAKCFYRHDFSLSLSLHLCLCLLPSLSRTHTPLPSCTIIFSPSFLLSVPPSSVAGLCWSIWVKTISKTDLCVEHHSDLLRVEMANEFYLKGYDSISVTNVRNNSNDECDKSLVVIILFLTSYYFFFLKMVPYVNMFH